MSTHGSAHSSSRAQEPFGSWHSPITAELIAGAAIKISELKTNAGRDEVFWIETRPQEKGRNAVVALDVRSGETRDAVPADFNSRTRVHEYGGGSFCASTSDRASSGSIISSDFQNQGLKHVNNSGADVADLFINDTPAKYRFADFVEDTIVRDGKTHIFAVCEDHTVDEPSKVVSTIVSVPVRHADTGASIKTTLEEHVVLVNAARDPSIMFSSPRVDPSGRYLTWVQWSHPNMPWDDTELFVAELTSDGRGFASAPVRVAGGPGESVMEPVWLQDKSEGGNPHLIFISDRNDGWWSIYRASYASGSGSWDIQSVLRSPGYEFGSPAWTFGLRHFDFTPEGLLIAPWSDVRGSTCLIACDPRGTFEIDHKQSYEVANAKYSSKADGDFFLAAPIPKPLGQSESIKSISSIAVDMNGNIYLIGGGSGIPAGVFKWGAVAGSLLPFTRAAAPVEASSDPEDLSAPNNLVLGELSLIRSSMNVSVDPAYLSQPQYIGFPTVLHGEPATAHGIFCPPHNPKFQGPSGMKPPLLVKLHGGPTGAAVTIFRLDIQFFTSRGIAVLDVDYGGSAGYGREYRKRLNGQWGAVDVEDCCRGALYLADKGLVDGSRLAIQGGSAGGYTALASVAFKNVFHAATSSYGIGDLVALYHDTHKFESRYMDGLVGPYPEAEEVYNSRCPVKYVHNIHCPILFLHGKLDPVCPPNQATEMYRQLVEQKIPSALVLYDNESHGWRNASTICNALNTELSFYGRIFKFVPDVAIDVDITNFEA